MIGAVYGRDVGEVMLPDEFSSCLEAEVLAVLLGGNIGTWFSKPPTAAPVVYWGGGGGGGCIGMFVCTIMASWAVGIDNGVVRIGGILFLGIVL